MEEMQAKAEAVAKEAVKDFSYAEVVTYAVGGHRFVDVRLNGFPRCTWVLWEGDKTPGTSFDRGIWTIEAIAAVCRGESLENAAKSKG